MYISTTYVGIKRSDFNYLFFLLTEDYIAIAPQIMQGLSPLLTEFARNLGEDAALVMPFTGDEASTQGDILEKFDCHSDVEKSELLNKVPALLVIDVDFDRFDPNTCNYLIISLRDSMNEYGQIKIFELNVLFRELVLGAKINYLFKHFADVVGSETIARRWRKLKEAIEIKPEIFGVSIDLKKAIEVLKSRNDLHGLSSIIETEVNNYGFIICPKCDKKYRVVKKYPGSDIDCGYCGQRLKLLNRKDDSEYPVFVGHGKGWQFPKTM